MQAGDSLHKSPDRLEDVNQDLSRRNDNMRKRLISILLILCMVLTLLPMTVGSSTPTARLSKMTFVMNGKAVSVPEAYNVSGNNYLQLRGVAALLNGTAAQFNVGWDGTYAVIETGKPYTGGVSPATLTETTNVRKSETQFKLDGQIISFDNAYFIGGNTNYLQLREVASKLLGTASQFNIYWDNAASQVVIVPGSVYTGEAPVNVNPDDGATTGAAPEDGYYNDGDVTWLGTTSEYQKTLAAFFDSGLRRVIVGDKYGLVDIYGAFQAQPIYDEIEAYYLHEDHTGVTNRNKQTERIFVEGYVQATRNGKMGLLNSKGKEVIPCIYDAVGLPSEGVSRIIKESNGVTYLGYWNVVLGREIVAPNKYVIPASFPSAATPAGDSMFGFYMPAIEGGRKAVAFDFYRGYALVPTEKQEVVVQHCITGDRHDRSSVLLYSQIIDTNGNEVLSGGPYPFNFTPAPTTPYPQVGPYMVYEQLSTKRLRMITDHGDEVIYSSHLESGIVGPQGIVVPAQYHGGISGNSIRWYPAGPQIQIIPELSLAITLKCGYEGFKESAAERGVINFSNKTIIPFSSYGPTDYDSKNNVFVGYWIEPIYRPDGTKIPRTDEQASHIVNGYISIGETYGNGDISDAKGVISVKTGKAYTHENLQGSSCTSVSASNTLWVKKEGKWGLVNLDGSIILPFEYEEINDSDWQNATSAYATVKKNGKWGMIDTNGKILLSCNYRSIDSTFLTRDSYITIQDYETHKYGVYSLKSGKITIECKFTSINIRFMEQGWGAIMGTVPIQVGNSLNALFDMDTGKQVTPTYLVMKPINRGLFGSTYGDIFGPDGKIVFTRAEDFGYHTLVVKDGKVGSINASRLAIAGKLPTTTFVKPISAPITPRSYLVAYPDKQLYLVGDGFDTTGLIVHYGDEHGVRSVVDHSKLKFYTSGTVELTQGRAFTTDGVKKVDILYSGQKVDTFEVKVVAAGQGTTAGDILQTGDYYMQVYGKYIYPVYASSTYWLELSDKKPDKPFTVKLVNFSEDRGPQYTIAYDGIYICQPSSQNGDQLRSSNIPHMWRINQYSSFCTIRDYGNQKLIVNASGQKSTNGTKVTVWSSTGSAPDNAKITFIKD